MANSRQLVPVLDRTYNSAYPNVADPDVIGLERDIDYLVGHLVNDNQNNGGDENCCRFISILGMGGLSKTTLARKIYNLPAIIRHFDCLSWVCVSQQWQTNDVLQRILLNFTEPDKRNEVPSIRDKDELAKQITDTLRGKRYFVVLDDIWSTDVWDCLKAAFPFENMSSKILLTTRKTEVAQRVGLESNLLHEPKLLNDEQSWELLKKKTRITGYRHTVHTDM